MTAAPEPGGAAAAKWQKNDHGRGGLRLARLPCVKFNQVTQRDLIRLVSRWETLLKR